MGKTLRQEAKRGLKAQRLLPTNQQTAKREQGLPESPPKTVLPIDRTLGICKYSSESKDLQVTQKLRTYYRVSAYAGLI
jgi:hypothetical protein